MRVTRKLIPLAAAATTLLATSVGFAQTSDLPSPLPPPAPSPAQPSRAATAREAELENRVRELESIVRALSDKVNSLDAKPAEAPAAADPEPPARPAPPARVQMPGTPNNVPLSDRFGPGFEWKSADDEFQFQFHNLTQFDGRFYEQGNQEPVHDTFGLPRQWSIFSGRIGKPYEYYVALAHGFDNLGLLDAFINIHYDDRFQIKAGRYKTPFTYEFYALPINGLVTPERSLFFNNFGVNRDVGIMAWGQLWSKRVDYAVGIFNGSRNGHLDFNDAKDVIAYLNYKPFLEEEGSPLENFNIGGSVDFGNQKNPPNPRTLRTAVPISGNAIIGVPFLTFRDDVLESGDRALWSLHAAWYVGGLSLMGEWQSGFQDYALAVAPGDHIQIPLQSYYVTAAYFLTGERVATRGPLTPLRPFDLRPGRFAPGAVELIGRVGLLDIGREVFTAGLSDPAKWSNRVEGYDLGVNWYLSQYIKTFLGWEHIEFGSPVEYRPGKRQLTSDLFWLRFQLYF